MVSNGYLSVLLQVIKGAQMTQIGTGNEVELVDFIHFCVERLPRIVAVFGVVSLVSILGGVVKYKAMEGGSGVPNGGVAGSKKELVNVSVLVQLPYVVDAWGVFRPIISPNLLKEVFSTKRLDVSVVEKDSDYQPSAALWVSSSNIEEAKARRLVAEAAKEIIEFVSSARKSLTSFNSLHGGKFFIVGDAKIAKHETVQPMAESPSSQEGSYLLTTKEMLKVVILGFLFGGLASIIYLVFDKIRVDYRQKYPKSFSQPKS